MCFVICLAACENFKGKMSVDNVDEITVTGADGKEYSSYRAACSNGDFDAAREFVEKMKVIKTAAESNDDDTKRSALEKSISEAEEYIFSSELNALASMNDPQATTRIILILNEYKVEGTPVTEGTVIGNDCYINREDYAEGKNDDYKKYMQGVSKFNLKCDRILDIAIACGNKDLAEKILRLIRQDATFYYKPSSSSPEDENYKDVYAHYTNESQNAAKKKYEEAVRDGVFK